MPLNKDGTGTVIFQVAGIMLAPKPFVPPPMSIPQPSQPVDPLPEPAPDSGPEPTEPPDPVVIEPVVIPDQVVINFTPVNDLDDEVTASGFFSIMTDNSGDIKVGDRYILTAAKEA